LPSGISLFLPTLFPGAHSLMLSRKNRDRIGAVIEMPPSEATP